MQAPVTLFRFRHWLAALLLLAGPLWAWAQAQQSDPPGRVAYVSLQEGAGTQLTDSTGAWVPAVINMPVTTGTRLSSEAGSRTELQGGWSAFRLSGKSSLEVTELDDDSTRIAFTEGTLSTRVRNLETGERFEIDTPNMALVANQPGEYRFDVDPRADTTRLSVQSGSATVYGDGGQAITVNAREQLVFTGRALNIVSRGTVGYPDAFDQWVSSRDAMANQSASARYVSPAMPGYQQLDTYGDWTQDATYGAVWYPRVTVVDWAPYRYGRWTWVDPWGWTWVDDAPWGFAPFHYGRWAQIGPRWAWVPGPIARRPVYAPALVGFAGGTSSGANWGVSVGTAWFPLAPGEYWEPHYRASQRYRHALNPWADARRPPPAGNYFFQRHPGAITAAPPNQFGISGGHRPRYIDGTRLPGEWAGTRVVPPPPRPNPTPGPDRNAGGHRPFPGDHAGNLPRGQQPIQPPAGRFPQRDQQMQPMPNQRGPGQNAQQRDEWGHSDQPHRNQRPQVIDQQRDAQRRDEWGSPAQPQRIQRPQASEQQRDAQRRDEWGQPAQAPQTQRQQQMEQQRAMQREQEQQQQRRDQQQRMEQQQRQAAQQQQQLMDQQRAAQREQQLQQHREQQQRMEQQRQAAQQQQQNQWRQQQMQQQMQRQQWEQQRQQQQRAQSTQREEQRGREQRQPGPRNHEGFN